MGLFSDLGRRDLIRDVSGPDVGQLLEGEPVCLYHGIDPTSGSLHVGNLMGICTLRRLQAAGHRTIVLIGGGTGLIGDPGGKSDERPLLDPAALRANQEGIRRQLEVLLGGASGDAPLQVVDNADWLATTGLLEFLRDVGKHFTVNQMIAKESVRTRVEAREQGISFTEFSYMLLQAYDFLWLHDRFGCRLQCGGSDQWGNITMGIDLIRRVRSQEVWGLTWPLVLRADGTKFGKTEAGTVWLDPGRTSPYELFQFFLRVEDSVVGTYLRRFTWLDLERIEDLEAEVAARPEDRVAQRELARAVTAMVHGPEEAARAERAAVALFGEGLADLDGRTLEEVFGDAPSSAWPRSQLEGSGWPLVEALVACKLSPSRTAARRTISEGGAYVNNQRITDNQRALVPGDLLAGDMVVLRRGRKQHHLVRFR